MSASGIIAIIAFCVMMIGSLAGGVFGLLMMEEVDRRNPHLNLYSAFSRFNRRLDKGAELLRQYRSLCPNGKLHIYELASFAVGFIGWITLVVLGLTSAAASK